MKLTIHIKDSLTFHANSSHEASTYFFISLYESFIWTVYMWILKTFPFVSWDGVELSPLLLRPLSGLLYQPQMMNYDECGAVCGMLGRGKPKYCEKICPSAALSTTNPTWPDPDSNPGRHGGKQATNCLRFCMAWICNTYFTSLY
jgi:hypothetical protein